MCHHSTETSLIHLLDSVYHAAADALATLLLSLDLSAAFDTIVHPTLLKRLSNSFGVIIWAQLIFGLSHICLVGLTLCA